MRRGGGRGRREQGGRMMIEGLSWQCEKETRVGKDYGSGRGEEKRRDGER